MKELAEREGFEPPVPFGITGFQDQRLKPLGHLSISEPAKLIIAEHACDVNNFLRKIFNCGTDGGEASCSVEKRSTNGSLHLHGAESKMVLLQ